jgi:hypothetical protein
LNVGKGSLAEACSFSDGKIGPRKEKARPVTRN